MKKLSLIFAIFSVSIAGVLLFRTGLVAAYRGRWENVTTFPVRLILDDQSARRLYLPFSRHNSKNAGDYYVFEWDGKLVACETNIIEAGSQYWLQKRTYPIDGTQRTIYLLVPFGVAGYIIGRLVLLFFIIYLVITVSGLALTKLGVILPAGSKKNEPTSHL